MNQRSEDDHAISTVTSAAFAAGLMLSVDNFVRVGWLAGNFGIFSTVLTAGAIVLYLGLCRSIFPKDNFEHTGLRPVYWFHYGVKMFAFVILATSLLVSSGFVFNEVFLYWFPNFAFAYLLLVILSLVQFLPIRWQQIFQIIMVAVPLVCLFILLAAAMKNGLPEFHQNPSSIEQTSIRGLAGQAMPALLLLVGFDLGRGRAPHPNSVSGMFWAIAGIGLIFLIWGIVSSGYLPAHRLTDSTIPHILVAKKILGQTGRVLMGLIIIFGSIAALNAVLSSVTTPAVDQRDIREKSLWIKIAVVLFLSAMAGGLMTLGVAGDASVDVYSKVALILWVASYLMMLINKIIVGLRS